MSSDEQQSIVERLLARHKRSKPPEDDQELLRRAREKMFAMIVTGPKEEYSRRALALPQPWRAVFTTFELDYQVRNGGFTQFFFNTEGIYNEALAEDLMIFETAEYSRIFAIALERLGSLIAQLGETDVESVKRSLENDPNGLGMSKDFLGWADLDERFYEASPSLFQLVAGYIRKNSELFI